MRATIERALGAVDVAMTERTGHGDRSRARRGASPGTRSSSRSAATARSTRSSTASCRRRPARTARRRDATRLGIIAQGTGGDFRKTLGLEHRLDKYLEALTSGRERALDVGKFTGGGKTGPLLRQHPLGGHGRPRRPVRRRRLAHARRHRRVLRRVAEGARQRAARQRQCTVTNDGKTEEHQIRSFMIAICNGRYFGSGMKVAPMAEVDDGVFELVALGATSKLGFAMTSRGIYYGRAHRPARHGAPARPEDRPRPRERGRARASISSTSTASRWAACPLTVEVVPKALTLRA